MDLTQSTLWPLVGIPALIFLARLLDVSMGTLRIVYVSQGRRLAAPALGFVEVLVWLIALSQIVLHLDRPVNYIAYAGGFAAGTWVGLLLEGRLALGLLSVQIITTEDAEPLVNRLGHERFGATHVAARGLTGNVRLIFSVIRRQDLGRLLDVVRKEHPEAFVSASDVRLAAEGYFAPTGIEYPRLLGHLKRK